MLNQKPCLNFDCQFSDKKSDNNCFGSNVAKCASYKSEIKKRPITVKELFECGASHVTTEDMIESIKVFGKDYIVLSSIDKAWPIDKLISLKYKFTTDRKTWQNFEVDV